MHPPNPFPAELTIGSPIGAGRRSQVFAGRWHGDAVVLKRYKPQAIRKYRSRYGVSIAQFEHDRNAAFCDVPLLREFAAGPVAWAADVGQHPGEEFFVQQRVEGVELRALLDERGRLPAPILQRIEHVVETASRHELFDIDMSPTNFRMVRDDDVWRPVLFDFNLMPQYLHAPNPLVALLYQTGLRHPAHRDRWMLRRLRTWPD